MKLSRNREIQKAQFIIFSVKSLSFHYSTSSADDLLSNFDNQQNIPIEDSSVIPLLPGQSQKMNVKDFRFDGTNYYIAVRATDEAGNQGPISNVAFIQPVNPNSKTQPSDKKPSDKKSGVPIIAWLIPTVVVAVLIIIGLIVMLLCYRSWRIRKNRTERRSREKQQTDNKANENSNVWSAGPSGTHGSRPQNTGSTGYVSGGGSGIPNTNRVPISIIPLGDYEIKKFLGGGAFGDVYLCYDGQLGRNFAMKRLKGEHVDKEVFI